MRLPGPSPRTDNLSLFSANFHVAKWLCPASLLCMDLITENSGKYSKLKEWPTRRIAFLVLSSTHLTNLAGPLDVFTRASALLTRNGKRRSPAYAVELLTADETPLMTGSGLGLIGGHRWTEAHGSHRHLACPGESKHRSIANRLGIAGMDAHSRRTGATRWFGLRWSFCAGRGRVARRAAGHHALGIG